MDGPRITGNHIEQDLVGTLTPDEIRTQTELGRKILYGETNKYPPGMAVGFLTSSARAGDNRALAYLAECYYTGKVTARDPLKAFDLALDSAEAGDPYGSYITGLIYFEGGAGERDYYQAVRYLTDAANAGIPQAQRLLGSCYYDGKGVTKDINAARDWLEKASGGNDKQAQMAFESVTREIEKTEQKRALIEKAMSGDRDAQIEALEECRKSITYNKSLSYKTSSESGLTQDEVALMNYLRGTDDPEIQYLLFEYYHFLLLNSDDKDKKASYAKDSRHYLEQSALAGRYLPAIHRLGLSYQQGEMHEKSPSDALSCFLEAAEQGYVDSMTSLSYMYEAGKDVEEDLGKALEWAKKALEQARENGGSTAYLGTRVASLSMRINEKKEKAAKPKIEKQPVPHHSFRFSVLWEEIDFNVYGILGAAGLYLMTVLYRALGAGLLSQPLINVHGFARFILVVISAGGIFFGIFVSLLSILMQIGLAFLAFYPAAILSLFIIVELHDHAQYFTYMTYFSLAVIAIDLIFITIRTIRKK